MQVKKQQLESDLEQWTGSKLGKEYIKVVYCHPAYLTSSFFFCWQSNVSAFYFLKFSKKLLHNTILVLPYINMNPSEIYMFSPSWMPLPLPPCSMHSTSCKMPGWMKHKLGEISITSDMQMTQPLSQKLKRNWRAFWWNERGKWRSGLKTQHSKN